MTHIHDSFMHRFSRVPILNINYFSLENKINKINKYKMVKSHLFAKNELSEMQKTRFDSYDVMMTSSQMTFSIFCSASQSCFVLPSAALLK